MMAMLVIAPLRGWYRTYKISIPTATVFAPLRGWYETGKDYLKCSAVIARLRGWYTKYITKHRKTEEPDG